MNASHGSTGDPERDIAARENLLEESLPQLFEAYDRATKKGMNNAVVFLVDCRDEIGADIARGWEGDEAVDEAILDAQAELEPQQETSSPNDSDLLVTLTRAFPFADCRDEVPQTFPYLSGTFEQSPPADGFLAVVIAFGGAATFSVPPAARQNAAEESP